MASEQNIRPVPMSKFEPDHFINYALMQSTLSDVKSKLARPLTYAEKLLYSHVDNAQEIGTIIRGETYLKIRPDRVASPDSTGQTVLLQFMSAEIPEVAVPYTVHCDHLIQAEVAGTGIEDLGEAWKANEEVYDFLSSACARYGIGFWKPGSGIIHQILLENYAFPGGLMLGTDSHTPNAGGLGMCAIGVGGADAVDVLAVSSWEIRAPKIMGVKLVGGMNGWTAPKDIILALAGIVTTKGGTGYIIEYFGPGVETLSCTGMATICNMGAELGATTSVFPYTAQMYDYLVATGRQEIADLARSNAGNLRSDEGAEIEYDKIIEIDLAKLEPHINGPYSPDLATPISDFARQAREHGWPENISAGLIGSCTNASYEDMNRACDVAQDALDHGLTSRCKFVVTPGSEQIRATIERDGQLKTLGSLGGLVLANACGPCIGQWHRADVGDGEPNSIISSYNRNFSGRNDGNPGTHSFLASPEIVVAMVLSGSLTFNPLTDTLQDSNGHKFHLKPPRRGFSLPKQGYKSNTDIYQRPLPTSERQSLDIKISPNSQRLQLLTPFPPWNGKSITNAPILIKCSGKTTTDAISAAGPWLKYRGHLDNISNNLLIGATNAYTSKKNRVLNVLTGKYSPVPTVARHYKQNSVPWIIIGSTNFGEGSSREHAALEIRHLGGIAVVAKSFARIYEMNLKRQGVLPFTFRRQEDFEELEERDRVEIDLSGLLGGKEVVMIVRKEDGRVERIELKHTLTEMQIEWFRCGSALNAMRKERGL
ncbi:Aconitate hydratase, mitochondrial [Pseudocercospora fuligena]|uniref:Aconitate hydratase, mitochondrial n=1 Tax=Pseudocercospora fuligena TaxID=685502 RepID=A0A8H6RQB3_9PEZI|nr:Aconitate hydratase, mitochondrial [Pseudocercospora fuligena]